MERLTERSQAPGFTTFVLKKKWKEVLKGEKGQEHKKREAETEHSRETN